MCVIYIYLTTQTNEGIVYDQSKLDKAFQNQMSYLTNHS